MFETLDDAIALAEFAHRHQKDKAGFAYIEHPKRVLANVQAMGAAPYVQIAAVLHDIAEDTPFGITILNELGFSTAVVNLVFLLSRKIYGTDYNVSAELYYHNISQNKDAVLIKTADINDNSLPWRLSYLSESEQKRMRDKYAKALTAINA